jgi:hypothetical protein
MPRFHLGRKVLITGPITTKYRSRKATVVSFRPNENTPPGVKSGDQYTVQFEEGDEADFLEIQLAAAEESRKSA